MKYVVAFLVLSSVAGAEIITVPYSGKVTQFFGSPFGIHAQVGTPVSGSFMYDTARQPTFASPGSADFITPIVDGFVMTIGGVSVTSWNYNVGTRNGKEHRPDLLLAQAQDDVNGSDFRVNGVKEIGSTSVVLADGAHAMFPDDNAVLMLPSQSQVAQLDYIVRGHVNDTLGNSLVFATVPEPTAVVLVVQAMLFANIRRKR